MEEKGEFKCKIHAHDLHKEKKLKILNQVREEAKKELAKDVFPTTLAPPFKQTQQEAFFPQTLSSPSFLTRKCPSCLLSIPSFASSFWLHLSTCSPSHYKSSLLSLPPSSSPLVCSFLPFFSLFLLFDIFGVERVTRNSKGAFQNCT